MAINAADLVTPAARSRSNGRTFTFFRISRQALPLTVRLPGRLARDLSLRSASVSVQPIGAGLVLGLLPGGNELTQDAPVNLRVLRGARTIFTYASTLGQLFPGSPLSFRIPWHGTPSPGAYHLIGTIRPEGSAVIDINQTIKFTPRSAAQLKRVTPPAAQPPSPGIPGWVWIVLRAHDKVSDGRCGRFAAVCATRGARRATSTAALACVASHPRIDHPDPAIYFVANPYVCGSAAHRTVARGLEAVEALAPSGSLSGRRRPLRER